MNYKLDNIEIVIFSTTVKNMICTNEINSFLFYDFTFCFIYYFYYMINPRTKVLQIEQSLCIA